MKRHFKRVWHYVSEDKVYVNTIYEIEEGILFSKPEGVSNLDGLERAFEFYNMYSKRIGKKINWVSDFSSLSKLPYNTRKYVLSMAERVPYNKIAIVCANFFMRGLIKLYSSVVKKRLPIKMFSNRDQAIEWLKES